jgi:hypothetical protein
MPSKQAKEGQQFLLQGLLAFPMTSPMEITFSKLSKGGAGGVKKTMEFIARYAYEPVQGNALRPVGQRVASTFDELLAGADCHRRSSLSLPEADRPKPGPAGLRRPFSNKTKTAGSPPAVNSLSDKPLARRLWGPTQSAAFRGGGGLAKSGS